MQQETADPLRPSTCPAGRSPLAGYRQRVWAGLKRHPLSFLLLLAGLVRGGVLYARFDQLQADPDAYRRLAETLIATGVYGNLLPLSHDLPQPTAFRPPLYPLVLAVLAQQGQVGSASVAILHWVCGLLTVAMVYWLTQFVCHASLRTASGRSPRLTTRLTTGALLGPFLAGLGTVVDPLLLNQSSLVMTETLAATLATTCLFLLSCWMLQIDLFPSLASPWRSPAPNGLASAGLAGTVPEPISTDLGSNGSKWFTILGELSLTVATGATLGLAILCRPTFLPWAALVLCLVLVRALRLQTRRVWALTCGLILVLLLTVLPWGLRNAFVMGSFKLTTTHGGYTFFLANNRLFYQFLRGDSDPFGSPDGSAMQAGKAFPSVDSAAPHPRRIQAEVWDAALFNANWSRQRDACVAATTVNDSSEVLFQRHLVRSQESVQALAVHEPATVEAQAEPPNHVVTEHRVEAPFVELKAADRIENGLAKPAAYAEFIADRCAYRLAWEAIRSDPPMFLYSCFVRTARFWRWLPHRIQVTESTGERGIRYAIFLWYGLQSCLVSVGLWRLRQQLHLPPCSLAICLFLVFTAVHALYWSDMRMRSPLIPTFLIFAAVGAQGLLPHRHRNVVEPS